jgi:2-(1,2-epoxy-1,2-dihydrophenyl)acetyl-CoA isomerase
LSAPDAAGSTGHIRYEVDEGIATITIDRPQKRNAMSWAVLGDFLATVGRAGQDDRVRVVVLTGAGGAFCAGTDLSDLADTPAGQRGRTAGQEGPIWPLVACPRPVVAAVDGPAVGMGAEFASQCGVRILSTRARLAWNFVHRGLVPDTGAGSWLLPRLIGVSQALRLLYSGEFLGPEEALALGFAARVVEPDDLIDAARQEAHRYLAGSPFAVAHVKRLVYAGLERSVTEHLTAHREALESCFASEDHREGVASFLERRPPRFVGR